MKKIKYLEIGSLIFCMVFSILSHYLFAWTNNSVFLSIFVPTNESVWEHSKLIFFPFFFYALLELFFLKGISLKSFLFAKSLGLTIACPLMIMLFYGYSSSIGRHILWVDILISVLCVLTINIISYKIIKKNMRSNFLVLFILFSMLFVLSIVLYTYYPLEIPLFLDTTSNSYGIK